ncbi:putative ABC transporter, ATP-binding protein [Nocardia nova SH22a]|uniref:Putative ABC transporter, ATP-binding protein n=1 Tax=Nocardia nova SH22a TaxID=1415166 RepID=W5TGE9_9NOCA|nr:ABC transporter ATP-binding protein [Nocardia nova]AHH18292.1 putative ABC transporter, ATP-binding protein [Nocardia nova SH22a]
MKFAYRVESLVKRYPGQAAPAVDGMTFEIREGEIFGMLGDNGAGKTTLVRQLAGLLQPTSGRVELFGRDVTRDPRFISTVIGYMPQSSAALNRLTVREAIYFAAHLRGLSRMDARRECDELLELWRLGPIGGQVCSRLSGGQRRLLQLAVAMSGHAPVLILDEPTNDLDPLNKRHVWEVLSDWNVRLGTTIVLVTHDAVEAEKVIQRVGIVQRGSFTALGTPAQLKSEIAQKLRVEVRFEPTNPPSLPCDIAPQEKEDGYWLFMLDRDDATMLLAHMEFHKVSDLRLNSTTLEDLYIHYAS